MSFHVVSSSWVAFSFLNCRCTLASQRCSMAEWPLKWMQCILSKFELLNHELETCYLCVASCMRTCVTLDTRYRVSHWNWRLSDLTLYLEERNSSLVSRRSISEENYRHSELGAWSHCMSQTNTEVILPTLYFHSLIKKHC